VLEIGDRRSLLYLHVLGVTADPDGPWTTQQARDLMVADLSEHAGRYRFVVRSQAGQFAASFDAVLADAGIEVVKIPPRCPAGELLRRAPRVSRPKLSTYIAIVRDVPY
jgi:putative transposase